ncbi:DUF3892 domain-containing protein [Candidatus Saganbacteria bacterium]|nr:DUF3892 domain-containing protein [Candidatus Saganbacteria bacterium]
MKIILVITDSRGKSILFINDMLQFLTIDEIAELIRDGKIKEVHIVALQNDFYIRSNPNSKLKDNLDVISITKNQFIGGLYDYISLVKKPEMEEFEKNRQKKAKTIKEQDQIIIDEIPRKSKQQILSHIKQYRRIIISAAKRQKIDPYLLGAILIDEYCRMGWDDFWGDWLGKTNINIQANIFGMKVKISNDTSPGIAQIKMSTAYEIIKLGYYNPEPSNKNKLPRKKLYNYLQKPKQAINFSAAVIRRRIDKWAPYADLTDKPAVLANLYSYDSPPNNKPKSGPRGRQIYEEFYPLAKQGIK